MKIELCAGSLEAISLANLFPFDRIELCQGLEVGGLTPSFGLFEFAKQNTNKELHILIRPRIGNFHYSNTEKELILRDSKYFVQTGCKGIVVGALTEQATLDLDFLKKVKQLIPNSELTFHRAFDEIKDKKEALQQLIDLGFNRILSAGTKTEIRENITELKELVQLSNKQIEIMIGGGITETNVTNLIQQIQPNAIHFSGTKLQKNETNSLFNDALLLPNLEKITAIFQQI